MSSHIYLPFIFLPDRRTIIDYQPGYSESHTANYYYAQRDCTLSSPSLLWTLGRYISLSTVSSRDQLRRQVSVPTPYRHRHRRQVTSASHTSPSIIPSLPSIHAVVVTNHDIIYRNKTRHITHQLPSRHTQRRPAPRGCCPTDNNHTPYNHMLNIPFTSH